MLCYAPNKLPAYGAYTLPFDITSDLAGVFRVPGQKFFGWQPSRMASSYIKLRTGLARIADENFSAVQKTKGRQSTDETTSHPTKQPKDGCQVIGYIRHAGGEIDSAVRWRSRILRGLHLVELFRWAFVALALAALASTSDLFCSSNCAI